MIKFNPWNMTEKYNYPTFSGLEYNHSKDNFRNFTSLVVTQCAEQAAARSRGGCRRRVVVNTLSRVPLFLVRRSHGDVRPPLTSGLDEGRTAGRRRVYRPRDSHHISCSHSAADDAPVFISTHNIYIYIYPLWRRGASEMTTGRG